ncbi:cytochrome P450 4d2-like [Plodia interpunctella]|uniref:cytochrome P450 4d2-like n=1 Tax=Plodia interpunctella TaxID=58824 RepID=UPI002367CB9D|nr:cytochrome P450 4d2-like [Plodia interpunctella]
MLFQAALCVILLVLMWWWRNRKFIQQYRKLGCTYTALPILGHAHMFIGNREAIMNTFIKFGEEAISRGGVAPLWLVNEYHLCIADALDCEAVLKNYFSKDKLLRMIRLLTGDSFIFAPVEIWKPRRRLMAPLFSVRSTNSFLGVFTRQSTRLAEQLQAAANQGPVALWPFVNAFTLDTACETVLGVELNSQLDNNNPLLVAVDRLVELAGDGLTKFWYQIDFIMKNHPSYRSFMTEQAIIQQFIDESIKEKEEKSHTIAMNPNTKEFFSLEDESRPVSLLEKLIQSVSAAGARAEALGLLLAAAGSAAAALAFTLLMLARHPAVQDKLYQELREVFGEDSARPVTLVDLQRLKYLEAVVRETLRLFPPAANIVREAHRDLTLPSGVEVLKGTNLILSIWGVQRNPKYWGPDAHEFRPERFLEGPLEHQSAFLAFSSGPRGCPGAQYASMVTKTAAATLLRRYRVRPLQHGPLRLLFSVTLKEIDNFTVSLQSRI